MFVLFYNGFLGSILEVLHGFLVVFTVDWRHLLFILFEKLITREVLRIISTTSAEHVRVIIIMNHRVILNESAYLLLVSWDSHCRVAHRSLLHHGSGADARPCERRWRFRL